MSERMWAWVAGIVECLCSGSSRDGCPEPPAAGPSDVPVPRSIASEATSSSFEDLNKYDVFLNHRGPDVKQTFVAHLYEALCTAGFHPFLDAESLVKGQHAFNSIDEALFSVRVHIAVFSKGYAESKYCLNELCDMLKSGKVIFPVFYDVEPEHLRRPHQGPFAAAFRKHVERGRKDDVKRWERALLEVANITGFRLSEVKGDEAQLKRRIVMAVQNASPVGLLQQVVQHRVGLQESVADVVKQLGRVGILGIVGMGGIGKTTLAKEVYNEFAKRQSFERQTFLQNVRTNDLLTLQKQLVHDLLGDELKFREEFHNCFTRLSRDRKVLIVLDDIDDRSKFDCLIPSLTMLMSQGSRIIVTSRDRNVLNFITSQGSTGKSNLYEVQVLNGVHAQQLFNWHAFYSEQASDQFRDLAKEVADACGGLPLALEVMGAYLFDKKDPKHEVVWKEATRSLRVDPGGIDQKLQNMFNISYEGLSSLADKLMLLDISCFMINRHENVAMSFWESCISCTCPSSKSPHSSLMRLIDKSLVKVSQNGYLQMHDVIRDMARDVVKRQSLQEVGERSHLCDFIEAKEVLENDKGSGKIRGFSLSLSNLGTPIVAKKFARMIGLHALLLDDCNVEGDFSTWPKKLRMLSWSCSPILELPTTLNLPNLVVLNLSQSKNLTCLWAQDIRIQPPCKLLEQLLLRDCIALERLPKNIGELSKLKCLDLYGCSTLKKLPYSIGQLQALQELDLGFCVSLETLPNSIGNLSKLKKIWLDYCKNLKGLPMTFGNLQSLVYLLVKGTSFSHLPDSFSKLFNLEELYLYDCMDLHDLPPSISGLVKLRTLYMIRTKVKKLPKDFGQLQSLKTLSLFDCKHLKALPKSFGCLERLEKLQLCNNYSLEMLPESFGQLKALHYLEMFGCSIGKKIGLPSNFGDLTKLKSLLLMKNLMSTIPKSFKDLSALVELDMRECPNLVVVEELPSNLETLNMGNCRKLTNIPSLDTLNKLKYLMLNNCKRLTHLRGLDSVKTLVEINISGCKMLSNAFGLNHDKALQMCGLSGSQISMTYDNNWWKEEPALQVVSYYNNVLPHPFPNCIKQNVFKQQSENKLCLSAMVLSEEDCAAIVFCFCAHELEQRSPHPTSWGSYAKIFCHMEAQIWRDGEEVYMCPLFVLRHNDPIDQIYLCTLRRHHQFVESLQFGDEIHVYARFGDARWASIVIEKGATIMVHGKDGHQTIVVNSNVLDKNKSKNLQEEFLKLNLGNNPDYNDHLHVVPSVTASSLSYYCDYCYEEILIRRWSCSMCGGFDLCDKCYEMRFNYPEYRGHVNSHPMFSYLV